MVQPAVRTDVRGEEKTKAAEAGRRKRLVRWNVLLRRLQDGDGQQRRRDKHFYITNSIEILISATLRRAAKDSMRSACCVALRDRRSKVVENLTPIGAS